MYDNLKHCIYHRLVHPEGQLATTSQTTMVYLLHKLRATFSYKSRGQFRFILFAIN
ncbi:hypothetical protein OIU77_000893 [Salix suchowensis]|uniref:Uncharacterized protein n=1 Tax=Salix suchowensis TaxID=1278906 RepID=A0ABQ9B8C7_9ROSI|nr:hypothetical protein OIU77_000893 [Salix suchowensis]